MERGNMTTRQHLARRLYTIPVLLFLLCNFNPAVAADVSLAWDASVSPNISGYKVYVGNSSRTYNAPITIANQTTYTVSGLTDGTFYFAVTAFDIDGNESDYSNEVSTIIGSSGPDCNINGDAAVNVLDLQALANGILGLRSTTGSDLNLDGQVNVLDLQFLNNVILGLRSCQ
jgi:hypothetical protein